MKYLNKINIKRILPFFISFFICFCFIYYKIYILDLILDKNFESKDYIRPAKVLLESNSFFFFLNPYKVDCPCIH